MYGASKKLTGFLELRRNQTGSVLRRDGEGNERGRYVHIVERAAHGVLAADGREAQVLLRGVRAEQGGQRLAEALRVLAQTLEVFLEGQVCGLEIAACCDELGDRLDHGGGSAEIRILLGEVRVEAEGHDGRGLALTV